MQQWSVGRCWLGGTGYQSKPLYNHTCSAYKWWSHHHQYARRTGDQLTCGRRYQSDGVSWTGTLWWPWPRIRGFQYTTAKYNCSCFSKCCREDFIGIVENMRVLYSKINKGVVFVLFYDTGFNKMLLCTVITFCVYEGVTLSECCLVQYLSWNKLTPCMGDSFKQYNWYWCIDTSFVSH